MLASEDVFRDAQHYTTVISLVGHASSGSDLDIRRDLAAGNACAIHRQNNRVAAVASVGRDRVSLAVEAASEQDDKAALESILKNQ